MNTSLPVRDPFYSIFSVVAVTVLSIAAFAPAGSESKQVSSQAAVAAPLVAVQSAVSLSPRAITLAHAEPAGASTTN